MNRVSRVTNGLIKHLLREKAQDEFIPLCRDAGDGLVLLLLGPPQAGKSLILDEVKGVLRESFKDQRRGALPVIDLQIETVSEGRTKPKWLGIELLKCVQHPIYKYIGTFDEAEHYKPSKGRDEATLRIALKEGLNNRFTRRVLLDEIHLLTRTKDPELRAAIMESIKSTCAIDRTLIGAGGYETAYKGLFDSPHFSGRVITYDFGSYDGDNPEHVECMLRILKTYSAHLDLKPKTLLIDECLNIMYWDNGDVGILDKHLFFAMNTARARHCPIDRAILHACAPPENERKVIAADIKKGRQALMQASFPPPTDKKKEEKKSDEKEAIADQKRKSDRLPFERSPNRNAAMSVVLHDDD